MFEKCGHFKRYRVDFFFRGIHGDMLSDRLRTMAGVLSGYRLKAKEFGHTITQICNV